MEISTLPTIFEGDWNEATVGSVTFRLGASPKLKNKSGITVVAFSRIIVQGKDLKTIEFVHATAKALDEAGVGRNFYSNPAKALKAITDIIIMVARRELHLPHYTQLKREHKGKIHVSPSLLKLGC